MRVERFKEICNNHGLIQLSEEETQKLMMGGKAFIAFVMPDNRSRVIAQINKHNGEVRLKNAVEISVKNGIDTGIPSDFFYSETELDEFEKKLTKYLKFFNFMKKAYKKFLIEDICKDV
jgi:hypothetical protein